jgi:hypothetical protein
VPCPNGMVGPKGRSLFVSHFGISTRRFHQTYRRLTPLGPSSSEPMTFQRCRSAATEKLLRCKMTLAYDSTVALSVLDFYSFSFYSR